MANHQADKLRSLIEKFDLNNIAVKEEGDDAVATYNEHSALLKGRKAPMSVDRMMKEHGADLMLSLPANRYLFLRWLHKLGFSHAKFKEAEKLPNCEICLDNGVHGVPAAVEVKTELGPVNACPEHSAGYELIHIYVEGSE